ncbi:hypothetical protein [Synechococcus sp. LTW-R]|uniref:hypothetical protein n=1 Tax=Synechococcus sp. LTW-R TaxID=2751170 RepID=UPI0016258777|nr:hypothetical protein [Synechococcus sp. LTW-R]QNG28638.1 hypothetical protein H0O22_07585 [Synechococcus sp. LTW-R]
MATYLLRDGSKVTADIILPQMDVFVYETDGGKTVQVVLSVEAEQFLLNSLSSKVVPLRRRMETAYKKCSA